PSCEREQIAESVVLNTRPVMASTTRVWRCAGWLLLRGVVRAGYCCAELCGLVIAARSCTGWLLLRGENERQDDGARSGGARELPTRDRALEAIGQYALVVGRMRIGHLARWVDVDAK